MKDELSKLLNEHKVRRRLERNVEDAEEKDHQAFQALAVSTIEKVISPALRALSEELKDHGHEASVFLLDGADSYPSAHLSFRIGDQDDPNGAASASRLSFSTTASQDKFVITTEIWGSRGKEPGNSAEKPESRPIAEVDSEWVTAQAMSFVRGVLNGA